MPALFTARGLARVAAAMLSIGLSACNGNNSSPPSDPETGDEPVGTASEALQHFNFKMVRSAATVAAGCLPDATANVHIVPLGPVELMEVSARGLPPNTAFDFFVIQVPNAPFGLSWYQGDMQSDSQGRAYQTFLGRFNTETFIVAPGVAPAPIVHDEPPFPDACTNPATPPVHTFHLGLWFNSPGESVAAGCAGATTPFNGEHNAGPQVLSTRNFPDGAGPLINVP